MKGNRVRPTPAEEIRKSFVNCSKGEAKKLTLPADLDSRDWSETDFLGWVDPRAVNNAYLVVPRDDGVVGVVLRANTPAKSALRSSQCAFCLTTHVLSDVGLFAAPKAGAAGRKGNTVGTYVCADLACSAYVRRKRRPSAPQPAETLDDDGRIARMLANINHFVGKVLD
ncbi:FBP domain-containing protein [Actinosynnema sp. NPDC023658]|uniref:FBP domain-containing protein n=1 Tax=Actinosynnema sp. NPDC023658 TaxID=3155465 RepID=UPI0033F49E1F